MDSKQIKQKERMQNMIKLTYKKLAGKSFKPVSEGYHKAFIVDYQVPFEAKDMKGESYPATRFMIETDEYTDDGKKRLVVLSKTMRLNSFHPKSNLYALACAVLQKKVVEQDEVPNLETLLYRHIDVVIEHNQKDDKTYANISGIFACKNPPTDWKSTYTPWESSGTETATDTQPTNTPVVDVKAEAATLASACAEADAEAAEAAIMDQKVATEFTRTFTS